MYIVPVIRLALPGDAVTIAHMSRDFIECGLGWRWRGERVRHAIADANTNVAVSLDEGRVAGFGIMEYGERHAHLALLAVAPPYRRLGLGRGLVAWLQDSACAAGLERVCLEARADNPGALAFYRRLGFEPTQRMINYYGRDTDALRLEKQLRAA
jgi:ribosomal protein S18 acetylase RimI-like enzyme